MNALLLGEGNSDRCLLAPIRWVLQQATADQWSLHFVDPARTGGGTLTEKIAQIEPCDLLFVHRDRDRATVQDRVGEIADAVGARRHVPVVPVRALEAWLLLDEAAIRTAAGRPAGTESLDLPPPNRVEQEPDPKGRLRRALLAACGSGRVRARFRADVAVYRVADLVDDWSGHRRLDAFVRLEADTRAALAACAGRAEESVEPRSHGGARGGRED